MVNDNSNETESELDVTSSNSSNQQTDQPNDVFKSLNPTDVLEVTVDNVVAALYDSNLYTPNAQALSSFTEYDTIAVVGVGRFIDEKIEEGGYGLNSVATRVLNKTDGYNLVITYDSATNEYSYSSPDSNVMTAIDAWAEANPVEGDIVDFLNENASFFQEVSVGSISGTATETASTQVDSGLTATPILIGGGGIALGLIIFITIMAKMINTLITKPIEPLPAHEFDNGVDSWSDHPTFDKAAEEEKERLSKIAEEKRLLAEREAKQKEEYDKAVAKENSYNDPSLTSLQNSINCFDDLAITHRYIDNSLSNEISAYVNNLRQLESRLLKTDSTNAETIRLDFKVVNDTVAKSLGSTYYIDICKNPALWDNNSKRLSEVKSALAKSNELVTDAIIKLNRNQVVNLRDGLSAILNRDDTNLVEKMLESN